MATIDELMRGKAPGSIKINCGNPDAYFIPHFKVPTGAWVGQTETGYIDVIPPSSRLIWVVYEEPNPKVKYYQWVVYDTPDSAVYLTTEVYPEGIAPTRAIKRLEPHVVEL